MTISENSPSMNGAGHDRDGSSTTRSGYNPAAGTASDSEFEPVRQDPIAVIGLAFRYPQEAISEDAFWKMLMEARCASTRIPPDRMNAEAFYHPDPKRKDSFNFHGGHFMTEGLDRFDAPFFSIQPKEAAAMDPHQRGLLEVTYHALESAGIPMNAIAGSNTSVYTACFADDYRAGLLRDPDRLPTYTILGTSTSTLANRISWFYDLKGASLNVDTACSSSLVALDQACFNLWAGESDLSVVTGGNVVVDPSNLVAHANQHLLSPDSRCFSFDHRANGYSTGEGYGVLILRRLSDALRNNECIRAVIRSTGTTSDGRTPGISQPSAKEQEVLIRRTYEKAGLSMRFTRFFEAHATGTVIGDPVEATAIGNSFKESRPPGEPMIVGAVKTNIGHLEAGSGVAGVIKAVLMLEHGVIPPNTNFEQANPNIDAVALNLSFPTEAQSWPSPGLRRISVNSFGFGGTNCHAIIEDAYHHLRLRNLRGTHRTAAHPRVDRIPLLNGHAISAGDDRKDSSHLLVWSAADQDTLIQLLQLYNECIPQQNLARLSRTLAVHRSALRWRTYAVIGGKSFDLQTLPATQRRSQPKLTFVFTGQGAQWAQMGMELWYLRVFRSSLEESDRYLASIGCTWSLLQELCKTNDDTQVHRAEWSQPLCTAIQLALVDLLRSLSITADTVLGHSSGEIAAAYSCGAVSRASALKIAYYRGLVTTRYKGHGAMIAVGLSAAEVAPYLDNVVVACVNSPSSTTLSGNEEAVDAVAVKLQSAGLFNRKLRVKIPYHSPAMKQLSESYRDLVGTLDSGAQSETIMISSLRGQEVSKDELRSVGYWVDNLTSPVLFLQALENTPKTDFILEVGPHSALQGPIRDTDSQWDYLTCLRRDQNDSFLHTIGKLFCSGFPVNLAALSAPVPFNPDLPKYPFNHSNSYWVAGINDVGYRFRKYARHDLLGVPVPEWNPEDARWRNRINPVETPFVIDHVVNGAMLYPTTGYVTMAMEAAKQIAEDPRPIIGFQIEDLQLKTGLVVTEEGVETLFSLRRLYDSRTKPSSWSEFILTHHNGSEWIENCRGRIMVDYSDTSTSMSKSYREEYEQRLGLPMQQVHADYFYRFLNGCGIQFGPSFQCLVQPRCSADLGAVSEVRVDTNGNNYTVHPSTLDSILHLHYLGVAQGGKSRIPTLVPTGIRKLWVANNHLKSPASSVDSVSESRFLTARDVDSTVFALSKGGDLCVLAEGIATVAVASTDDPLPIQRYHWMTWKLDVEAEPKAVIKVTECSPSIKSRYKDLTMASVIVVSEALRDITAEDMAILDSYQRKYVTWIKAKLAEFHAGSLPGASNKWELQEEKVRNELLQSVAEASNLGRLIVEVGRYIPAILRKDIDLHEILFSEALASSYYADIFKLGDLHSTLEDYLNGLAHKYPNMHVLEIGAGTGSLTEVVLKVLGPRFGKYCFTDISHSFLEKARLNFTSYGSKMEYKIFNMGVDPVKQQMQLYDLIIAFGVLHVTKDVVQTLRNIRKILRPGGKLIVCDPTRPDILRANLVFGLLSDWWLSTEGFRSDGPVITEEKWADLLQQTGFSGFDLLTRDFADQDCHEHSMFVTTALASESTKPPTSIITDGSAEQTALAESLQNALGIPTEIVSLQSIDSSDVRQKLFISILEYSRPLVYELDEHTYLELQSLLLSTKAILWVTRDSLPQYAASEGLFRALRNEDITIAYNILTLGVDPTRHVEHIRNVVAEMMRPTNNQDPTVEFREMDGKLHINRLEEAPEIQAELLAHRLPREPRDEELGEEPLTWSQGSFISRSLYPALDDDEVEIQVAAVGLNTLDALIATGRAPGSIGAECSGTVIRAGSGAHLQPGSRVMACGPDLFGPRVRSRSVVEIPTSMSFEHAASLPVASIAAFYALREIGRLKPGESVLIHSGVSSLDQTCIQVAQHMRVEVFVTGIGHGWVSSKNVRPVAEIKRVTNGKGVSIILNTQADDDTTALLRHLAPLGQYIELGSSKKSLQVNSDNFSYHRIDPFLLVKERPELVRDLLSEALPIVTSTEPLHVHNVTDIQDAFDSVHKGKTVVTLGPYDIVKKTAVKKPLHTFNPNATYVISGGLGTCGRAVAEWMVDRGARHLLLLSRSGIDSARPFVESLRARGAQVEAPACNVNDADSLRAILDELDMPPIKGCIQGAVLIDNVVFPKMTYESWRRVTDAKFTGSWNLHELLPKGMDFFILFSSMSGCIGFSSQASYDAGSTFQDGLARYRLANGERATSLNLGPIDLDGPNYRSTNFLDLIHHSGYHLKQSAEDLCDLLELICAQEAAGLRSEAHAQILMGIEDPAQIRAQGRTDPIWMHKALFSHFYTRSGNDSNEGTGDAVYVSAKSRLPGSSDEEAAEIVVEALRMQLTKLIGISIDAVDFNLPLAAYGLDSLVTVDLRNWLSKELGADVPIFDLSSAPSLHAIAVLVSQRTQFREKKE